MVDRFVLLIRPWWLAWLLSLIPLFKSSASGHNVIVLGPSDLQHQPLGRVSTRFISIDDGVPPMPAPVGSEKVPTTGRIVTGRLRQRPALTTSQKVKKPERLSLKAKSATLPSKLKKKTPTVKIKAKADSKTAAIRDAALEIAVGKKAVPVAAAKITSEKQASAGTVPKPKDPLKLELAARKGPTAPKAKPKAQAKLVADGTGPKPKDQPVSQVAKPKGAKLLEPKAQVVVGKAEAAVEAGKAAPAAAK